MPTVFISEPLRIPAEFATDHEFSPWERNYLDAVNGVLQLCADRGWSCYRTRTSTYDDLERRLKGAEICMALRIPHMRSSTQVNWECLSAIPGKGKNAVRDLVVFKVAPTAEFDEYWSGKPHVHEVLEDTSQLFATVERLMEAHASVD